MRASYGSRNNSGGAADSSGIAAFNATSKVACAYWMLGSQHSGNDPGTTDVFAHQDPAGTQNAYAFSYDGTGNGPRLNTWNGSTLTSYQSLVAYRRVALGRWIHCMIIADGTSVRHLINGLLIRRVAQSANFTANVGVVRTRVVIPAIPFGGINGDFYDVRIWAQSDVDNIGGSAKVALAVMRGHPMGETGRYLLEGPTGIDYSGRGNNLTWVGTGQVAPPPPMVTTDRGGGPKFRYHPIVGKTAGTHFSTPAPAIATWTVNAPATTKGTLASAPAAASESWTARAPTTTLGTRASAPAAASRVWTSLAAAPTLGTKTSAPASASAAWTGVDPDTVLGTHATAPAPASSAWTGIAASTALGEHASTPSAAQGAWTGVDPDTSLGAVPSAPPPASVAWTAEDPDLVLGALSQAPAPASSAWTALSGFTDRSITSRPEPAIAGWQVSAPITAFGLLERSPSPAEAAMLIGAGATSLGELAAVPGAAIAQWIVNDPETILVGAPDLPVGPTGVSRLGLAGTRLSAPGGTRVTRL
jgi:hypothetical protein